MRRGHLTLPRNLTGRQRQLAALVVKALCDKDIAKELEVSVRTVRFHLTNLFEKLGASNRTDAAVKLVWWSGGPG